MTFNKDVTRFVKLGQQCMDRVASIAVDQGGISFSCRLARGVQSLFSVRLQSSGVIY